MNYDVIPEPHDLSNKPLVEAIFELRWELRDTGQGFPPQDPGFRIALGRYYDAVKEDYPFLEDLPSAEVPEVMTAYSVRHRFRSDKDKWPLTQIGPGILTVNDTEGYTWTDFRSRILIAVDEIFKSYPSEIHKFKPNYIQLHYIDAIHIDPDEMDPAQFINQFLHTEVKVDPRLFEKTGSPENLEALRLNLTYSLKNPKGDGILNFARGIHKNKPSIILEITIRSKGENAPFNRDHIESWIEDAHSITDNWFFTLSRGELMRSFEEET
ncbi:MAG: TIGR04255 family protein [Sedimentisphaerales bacterium]|nr:TIGR04255 family protein [Sedimentisphaerales bacterium]